MTAPRIASAAAPGQAANEDSWVHAGGLVGVLDGVTQPPGLDSGCRHGPAWYSSRLAARLAGIHRAAPDCRLTDLVAEAIEAVGRDHGGGCDLRNPLSPAAALCLLRTTAARTDYLVLCDTTLVIQTPEGVRTVTDHRLADTITRLRDASSAPGDPGAGTPSHGRVPRGPRETAHARALRYSRAKAAYTNRPGGYWIAAADAAAAAHALIGTLPATGPLRVARAALLTDGAARAVDRFALFGWPHLLDLVSRHGPHALIRAVRAAECAADRDDEEKTHDDATVAYVEF